MKKPQRPPADWNRLRNPDIVSDHVSKIIQLGSISGITTGYLHWDELRFRNPPEGLSHKEWWFLTKLSRSINPTYVTLFDKSELPFRYSLVDPIPQHLHEIDLQAGGSIKMPEPVTNPDTRDEYTLSSLFEEAITSSQVEGAGTTRSVAKELLRSGRPPRNKGERMILNNFLTMREISSLRDEPLSTDLIFRIHGMVTDSTLDDPSEAGRFRREEEEIYVVDDEREPLHIPPPAAQLSQRLQGLCDFANGRTPVGFVHPAIRSMILHFWLAYDHPFVDGNGRTARALFYWSMLHHGYWLFEFISISRAILRSKAQYLRAFLYTETDDNDLTYFLLYHCQVIRRAVDELHTYIERKTRRLQAAMKRLRGMAALNHRQVAIIEHALRHPGFHYTIQGHQRNHNVVYQTARTDLLELSGRGLFTQQKMGRTWNFSPVPDLEQRLSAKQP
jgi:Fic family protein